MRVLVTGANGFVGKHLIRELHARDITVLAIGHGSLPIDDVKSLLSDYRLCNLTDPVQVAKLPLDKIDSIINLAGLANLGASFTDPNKYKHVNVAVAAVLGKRLLEIGSHARLIAISTGAVYAPGQPLPLTEESKTISDGAPYALSKLAMETAVRQLQHKGLDCVIVRPFNHAGPGQAVGFLIPDLFAKLGQAKESGGVVQVGNLTTKRDYTDVRDIVKAYADLAVSRRLASDLYNVCSGQSYSGQEVLNLMTEAMDLKDKFTIKVDQSLIRPTDPPDLYGSHKRLTKDTGWKPTISLETTIRDFIKDR